MRRLVWGWLVLAMACGGGEVVGELPAEPLQEAGAQTQTDGGIDASPKPVMDGGKDADAGCVWERLFTDADGDGYGTGQALLQCPGPKLSTMGGDCDDTNPLVHPGQTEAQKAYDSNCDGSSVPTELRKGQCDATGAGCGGGVTSTKDYWLGSSPPACGTDGQWVVLCKHVGGGKCSPDIEYRPQKCL